MGSLSGFWSRKDAFRLGLSLPPGTRVKWWGNWCWFQGQSPSGPYIGLALFTRIQAGNWSVKEMDEGMGPCYYRGVPRSWLDEIPDPRVGYSTEWRQTVRKSNGWA